MKNRVQCVTRKCDGSVPMESTSVEGHWQFQCPKCKFWNLASNQGAVQATSQTPFDLDRLPSGVRSSLYVKRSPPGGV
jgi:hypothetical protein